MKVQPQDRVYVVSHGFGTVKFVSTYSAGDYCDVLFDISKELRKFAQDEVSKVAK